MKITKTFFFTFFAIFLTLTGCSSLFTTTSSEDPMDSTREEALSQNAKDQNPETSSTEKSEIPRALKSGVIMEGMSPQNVISVLGNPDFVDYAGNPQSGNSRWTYSNGLSDKWKMSSPRIVYFESNRVTGWANMDTDPKGFKH